MDGLSASHEATFPPKRAQLFAKGIVILLLAVWFLSYPYGIPRMHDWRVPIAYLFPFVLGGLAVFAMLLFRSGTGKFGKGPLLLGWGYVAGGVVSDVGATLAHTPDLALEGNLVARALLDSGHGTGFLYVYGGLAQGLIVVFLVSLWSAFLRHRDLWLGFVMSLKPRSFGEFFRMALSGKPVTWAGFFLPFGRSRRKVSYCIFWIVVPILMGVFLHRWYLAMTWLGWLPPSWDARCMAAGAAAGLVLFAIWLWREYAVRTRDERTNLERSNAGG